MNETKNFENFLSQLISYSLPLVWKIILVIALILLMGYLNYKLNKFYNKYNLSTKIKNAEYLKLILHILIWVVTLFLIVFTLLKSSPVLILLFLIFIIIVLIIAVSDLAKM